MDGLTLWITGGVYEMVGVATQSPLLSLVLARVSPRKTVTFTMPYSPAGATHDMEVFVAAVMEHSVEWPRMTVGDMNCVEMGKIGGGGALMH